MKYGLLPTVLPLLAVLALGLVLGSSCDSEPDPQLQRMEDSIARLERVAVDAKARADSLESVTHVRVDTFTAYVTRWRTRTDTLTVTQVIALADSTITACENALVSCLATVEAKDSAITVLDAKAAALDAYAEELADRLARMESRRKWRDMLMAGLGGTVGYSVCSLAGR